MFGAFARITARLLRDRQHASDAAFERSDGDPPLVGAADELKLASFDERPKLIVADAAKHLARVDDGNEEGF